jgi:hypothetical protein
VKRPFGGARLAAGAAAALTALLVVCMMHAFRARRSRSGDAAAIAAVAVRLPSGDLALSGGSRWLRAPSLEEPWGAFADGPAVPDPDPAGAIAPPRFLAGAGARP